MECHFGGNDFDERNSEWKYDYENYLCTLLLSEPVKSAAFAVRAFNVEIAQNNPPEQPVIQELAKVCIILKFWIPFILFVGNFKWKTIFPDFITLEGSCLFIKKLIAVSLSAVTYIRGIFPEKAYGERNLYGLRLKLLTEDSGMKSVTKFINLIRGCYDAVEKKYEVIEAYNLVFSYKDDECSVTYQNKTNSFSPKLTDPTVEASLLMLKNISVINNILGELPKNAYLSLKLLYYDDVTPDDYEPPGFEPSTHAKFSFPTKTMNIALGKVNTKIHGPGTEKYEVQKSQIIEYGLQKYFPTNHEENGRIFEKDSKILSNDESEEAFSSQKKQRTKKKRR
ncbi:HORMA domain-containing protein 1 [Argiope bruennichi]|uniref:HORMA domain-containing protein 1 n=1 Tax=Argiope bruennichi TaxID=94029 RepID=A0A8T0F6F8_ARGBR|nr:HORMA domain-containing protein 1 [Argiope bruennichi]